LARHPSFEKEGKLLIINILLSPPLERRSTPDGNVMGEVVFFLK
jgi:hypothetical protein